jgi:SAM-dependent methyltransferase
MTEELRSFQEMLRGAWPTRVVLSAVELDVFTPCTPGPASAVQVAAARSTDPRATEVLLDALAALGLLLKHEGTYRAAPLAARHLSPGAPQPLVGMILHQNVLWNRWSHLTEVVRSGQPAPREAEGEAEHEAFIRAMADHKAGLGLTDLLPVDLEGVRRVVDLGGGPGTLAVALTRALPMVEVVLVDRPETLDIAARLVPADLWGSRIRGLAADLETGDPVGSGYDLAILSAVLHAFGPRTAARVVDHAVRCLAPGGRLVVREQVLEDDRTGPVSAALFSVNMLVGTREGRSYTAREIAGWMEAAGLGGLERHPTERGEAIVGRRA